MEHRAGRLVSIFLSGIERRKDISISSMQHLKKAAAFFLLVALSAAAAPKSQAETRYLLFQIFTSAGSPYQALGGTTTLKEIPDRASIQLFARSIKDRIGTTGDKRSKLGIALGPIALDHTDQQVKSLIRDSFAVARTLDMAVALHLDDSIFWSLHPDLRNAKGHVEWSDWKGTETTGRRLDWGPGPKKVAPQLCFNSLPVLKAVRERASLIGREIMAEYRLLKEEGREHLFAGVITGWETMMSKDFESGRALGYCALKNAGYDQNQPPRDLSAARAAVVKEFMELWAASIRKEGVPAQLIYNHIAFTAQGLSGDTYDHPPGDTAFSGQYRTGLSTYPTPGTFKEIYALLTRHGNPPWASVEGTNVIPNGQPGEKTMESYLGRMFNHGAVMVNIFAWGLGENNLQRNFFRRATEGPEAIAGYQRFLSGEPLREDSAQLFSPKELQNKIHDIQARLPLWVQRTRRQRDAEVIMRRLESHLKSRNLESANDAADEALKLLEQ